MNALPAVELSEKYIATVTGCQDGGIARSGVVEKLQNRQFDVGSMVALPAVELLKKFIEPLSMVGE